MTPKPTPFLKRGGNCAPVNAYVRSFSNSVSKQLYSALTKAGSLLCIFFSSSLACYAQHQVKGRVTNLKQTVTLATVNLFRSDSSLAGAAVTDTLGAFIFSGVQPGNYFICTSAVGYSPFCSNIFSVDNESISVADIVLKEAGTRLEELTVTAKKPLYEQRIDRLVVNVQSSITSSGNTVLGILEKSPGIVVNKQNNSINMNGKAGVRIMINDKIMRLPMDAVVQMLDGMSAANVDKIELISVPPSKYEAEGNAGIIRIVMKANAEIGTNGSLSLTAGCRWAENLGVDFNLNHRGKRLSFYLDYSIVRNHNLHVFEMVRRLPTSSFVQTVNDFSRRENVTIQQNLNAGAEWRLSSSTLLNLSLTGYRRNWDLTALATEKNTRSADTVANTGMNIHESNIWQSVTAGIVLQTKIDSRQSIDFGLDYLYYHNSNPSTYNNALTYNQSNVSEQSIIDLQKLTPIRFYIASTNYQYKLSPAVELEAGAKGVTSTLSNNVFVRRFVNNVWTTDSFFSSSSTLDEQAGALYASAKWKAGNRWQVNGGLRYEYTHTSISSPVVKNLVDRKYGYIFPSLYLRKEFEDAKDLQFAYSKRITRPTYNDIAPWVFFWDPGTFSAGNTSLLPAISDALKTDFHRKQWIISVELSHSKHEISFLQPEVDTQSNYLIYRSQNMKYLNGVALTNSYSFHVTTWWQVQTNVTGQYQTVKTSHLQNNKSIHLYGLNTYLTNSFSFPNGFFLEISGTYQTKSFWGISYLLPNGSLNAAVKKTVGKNGSLRLAMDDILNNSYWRFKTLLPDNKLDTYFSYNFHNRYIRLVYTRSFGNSKLKAIQQKAGAEEERKRVGN